MIKSYVYRCDHKFTGKFYIGYRKANTVPARSDFGTNYFTSCPEVSNNFQDYTYKILGEFRNSDTAFEIEQKLIHESRNNPLLINKQWKNTRLDINPAVNIKSLVNHVPRIDVISGNTKLVKKKKKSKKIRISTERERLGLTSAEFKQRRDLRRAKKLIKNKI